MISFKDFFLLEESAGYGTNAGKRTIPIDEDQFFDLYKKNCKLYNPDRMKIYRGNRLLDDEDTAYAYSDPRSASPRPSRNTESFTMWLMENMDEWQKYPRRSQSLICSTTSSYARSYGRTFVVIPYDTARVGVCATSDFFHTITDNLGADVPEYNSLISTFIEQTIYLMRSFGKDKNINAPTFGIGSYSYGSHKKPPTKEHFFSLLKSFDRFYLKHPELIGSLSVKSYYSTNTKIEKMIIDGLSRKMPLVDILGQKLTPEENGFELYNMQNFDLLKIAHSTGSYGNEVWTDGPALFVEYNSFDSLNLSNVKE